jgi:hypothetical protein
LKKHLSFANVMSCVAIFMALSGAAYAATLGKNAVKTKNIASGAVTAAKIKNSSVTAAKLANGAVIGSKIANGAVGASKLAEASVRSSALGGGVVTTGKLKDLNVTEGKLASNAVTAAKISAGAVETGKLAKEAVTGEKLATSLLAQLVKNVSYVTSQTVANAEAEPKFVTAQCPAGKEVIGGGARVTGAEVTKVAVTESFSTSVDVSGKRTGWHAVAMPMAAEAKAWGVEAVAICAEL